MKVLHAAQPVLCDACMQLLHARIEANPLASHQLIPCRHATGVVAAVVAIDNGRITSWTLYGPLDEHEATAIAHTERQLAVAFLARSQGDATRSESCTWVRGRAASRSGCRTFCDSPVLSNWPLQHYLPHSKRFKVAAVPG